MPEPTAPEILSFDEADARLGGALSAELEASYEEVLFFDGDLTLHGDFLDAISTLRVADQESDDEDDDEEEGDAELIVVAGNLTVSGRIALYEDLPGLFVAGRTEAETLEAGDAEVYIHDGSFTYLVYGEYNHGSLRTGVVSTPWVIESDHAMDVSAPGAVWVDIFGDAGHADFDRDDIADVFVPEVVGAEDGELLVDEFLERLRAGLPVLLPGARTAGQAVRDLLAQALADRAEHLDLTGRKLQEFPAAVLQMPWLRTLILDGNLIGELPEALGSLTELEVLSACGCGLKALPESISDLSRLRVLRVARNYPGDEGALALPASVGKLAALEELDISGLSGRTGAPGRPGGHLPERTRFVLPDSFGSLAALRRLAADGTNVVFPESAHGMTSVEEVSMSASGTGGTFPEAVTAFPNLRRLDLSHNTFGTIPASLLRLTRLEGLNLDGSLGMVNEPLPDLGSLPALRVLGFSGHSGHAPVRGYQCLTELLGMELPGLEELRIDRWHRDGKRDRLQLTPADLAGLGNFRGLRALDLSFNRLTDLPPEFGTLGGLVVIDLRYNQFPGEVRDRIAAAHPAAQIDFDS